MKEENIKRVRLLRIWEILKQETDEDHPMGTPTLLEKLNKTGIVCDRRTLYADITSYKAQIDYYTNYIKSRTDWEFVNVYTDEGISATNTKHRDGFKQMIEDALNGKIDLIVTKSVSRFARNTVDSLTAVRKLKDHGIEVFFEKENIYTFDSKGELLITIMSSLAQEESRSISENVTCGLNDVKFLRIHFLKNRIHFQKAY